MRVKYDLINNLAKPREINNVLILSVSNIFDSRVGKICKDAYARKGDTPLIVDTGIAISSIDCLASVYALDTVILEGLLIYPRLITSDSIEKPLKLFVSNLIDKPFHLYEGLEIAMLCTLSK